MLCLECSIGFESFDKALIPTLPVYGCSLAKKLLDIAVLAMVAAPLLYWMRLSRGIELFARLQDGI